MTIAGARLKAFKFCAIFSIERNVSKDALARGVTSGHSNVAPHEVSIPVSLRLDPACAVVECGMSKSYA